MCQPVPQRVEDDWLETASPGWGWRRAHGRNNRWWSTSITGGDDQCVRGGERAAGVDHGDGLTTRYAHLGSEYVNSGDLVDGGQVIGTSGSSGNLPPGADSHLHFEIRNNGVPQDPTTYFNYQYEEAQK